MFPYTSSVPKNRETTKIVVIYERHPINYTNRVLVGVPKS